MKGNDACTPNDVAKFAAATSVEFGFDSNNQTESVSISLGAADGYVIDAPIPTKCNSLHRVTVEFPEKKRLAELQRCPWLADTVDCASVVRDTTQAAQTHSIDTTEAHTVASTLHTTIESDLTSLTSMLAQTTSSVLAEPTITTSADESTTTTTSSASTSQAVTTIKKHASPKPPPIVAETSDATRRRAHVAVQLCATAVAWLGSVASSVDAQTSNDVCSVHLEMLLPQGDEELIQFRRETLGNNQTSFSVSTEHEGRPFVVDGRAVVSDVRRVQRMPVMASSCEADAMLFAAAVDEETAAAAASSSHSNAPKYDWLRQARNEHASVASFAKFSLQLMAVGAPSPLLFAAMRAGQDEVRHADSCLAMINGRDDAESIVSFDAFPPQAIDRIEAITLEQLALSTFREGGVGELVSALRAVQRASTAADSDSHNVAKVWRQIAQDEARHALLAWRTIEWTLSATANRTELRLQLAQEMQSTLEQTSSFNNIQRNNNANNLFDDIVAHLVQPLYTCIVDNTPQRDPHQQLQQAASLDKQLDTKLAALSTLEFNVENVIQEMKLAINC